MPDNLVIPQNNSSTNIPANQFSVGTLATDNKSTPNTTSALNTMNVLSAARAFSSLTNGNQITLSQLVTGYYQKYATGTSLFTLGTSNTDIHMSSLVGAQTLYVTITAYKETKSRYHTTKDASIVVGFTYPSTWQRTESDWTAFDSAPLIGSYTISVNGATSTVVNGNPYTESGYKVTVASGLHDGPYQVTVKDNNSGFYLITNINCPYDTPNANVYRRVPGLVSLNNGTWTSTTAQGYG
tara:strand:- start:3308 stop:4027 length:720 start_codon:yes stop_codon:yes gene_type:complete